MFLFACDRLVEEIARNLSEVDKEQLNRKPLFRKSEEWQNTLQQKRRPNQFDQPIKMELDKIPDQEVGQYLQTFKLGQLSEAQLFSCQSVVAIKHREDHRLLLLCTRATREIGSGRSPLRKKISRQMFCHERNRAPCQKC